MAPSPSKIAQESTESAPATSVAQQGDNIAHALAGAGGGLLSMILT
jgi:solute carrier family 25 (peroxisomal adenine nucleotide transporter), member 17